MIRKVAEEHHHTPAEVEEYLREARGIVGRIGFSGGLEKVAFEKAVDLLAAKQMWHEQVAPSMAIPGQRLHG